MLKKLKPQMEFNRFELHELIPLNTPLVIYVEASSFCNLACNFCPHHLDPDGLHKQNMTFDIFQKIINDINKFPKPLKMLRMCGTGDSTFNKKLPEMLEYAASKRYFEKYELISNGLLLNDRLIDSMTSHLNRIIISIEGLTEEEQIQYFNIMNKIDQLVDQEIKLSLSK